MFRNRTDAGERLVPALQHLKSSHPIVLALPRGGVPIGAIVAAALGASLDLILVRKIGAPGNPELAAGAVVDGGAPVTVLNDDVVRLMQISEDYLAEETDRQLKEIERRRGIYLGDRPRPQIQGRTVIVIDDGIATGATVRAALRAVRKANPDRLILAVPVASSDVIAALRPLADETICLESPDFLGAIGPYYLDFSQVGDSDVQAVVRRFPVAAEVQTDAG